MPNPFILNSASVVIGTYVYTGSCVVGGSLWTFGRQGHRYNIEAMNNIMGLDGAPFRKTFREREGAPLRCGNPTIDGRCLRWFSASCPIASAQHQSERVRGRLRGGRGKVRRLGQIYGVALHYLKACPPITLTLRLWGSREAAEVNHVHFHTVPLWPIRICWSQTLLSIQTLWDIRAQAGRMVPERMVRYRHQQHRWWNYI